MIYTCYTIFISHQCLPISVVPFVVKSGDFLPSGPQALTAGTNLILGTGPYISNSAVRGRGILKSSMLVIPSGIPLET